MGGVSLISFCISLLVIAGLAFEGHAECNLTGAKPGTRHNGSEPFNYPSGTVIYFSCDTGYSLNYDEAKIICLPSGEWEPPDLKCQLDLISLGVAVAVALVAIIAFSIIAAVILKRRSRVKKKPAEPKVIMRRRAPKFPDESSTSTDSDRRISLYDSVILDDETDITSYDFSSRKRHHNPNGAMNQAIVEEGTVNVKTTEGLNDLSDASARKDLNMNGTPSGKEDDNIYVTQTGDNHDTVGNGVGHNANGKS